MKHIVGVADMKITRDAGDMIVTHALGSCLGISAYDPVARVGGLLHVMMPDSSINPDKAKTNPCMFVDTALPAFFQAIYGVGALKNRLVVKVAGGANVNTTRVDSFKIGKRNFVVLKKMFWKNGVVIEQTDVGGSHARTMYLRLQDGKVWLSTSGVEKEL